MRLEETRIYAEIFDTFTRTISSRALRRVPVGLAAAGLLSIAVPDAEAMRCIKKTLCPLSRQCRHHRCKPDQTQNGLSCGVGFTCQNGVCGT